MNTATPGGAPPRWDPTRIRRLLVMRLDNLGDVVLLTPALRALRHAFPHAHIALLAAPAGARIAPLLPWVNEVREARVLWQDASGTLPFDPRREQALIDDLAGGDFDVAVISTSFSQSPHVAAYACYLAGIPLRAGFAADFAGGVLSHAVPPPRTGTHQADRCLALVAALGIPPRGSHLELRLPSAVMRSARSLLRAATDGGPYAVLAPGASCPSRRYDLERFGQVAGELARGTGMPVLVVGSERERSMAVKVAAVASAAVSGVAVVPVAGRTTVPELAAVIAGAAVVITNNSGPMHLAEAFVRPTVVLFAGTEREGEYAPRAAPVRVLRQATACAPCRSVTCPFSMECLDLQPRDVARAALDLLSLPRSQIARRGRRRADGHGRSR